MSKLMILVKDKIENRTYIVDEIDKKYDLIKMLEIGGESEERYIFAHELVNDRSFSIMTFKEEDMNNTINIIKNYKTNSLT